MFIFVASLLTYLLLVWSGDAIPLGEVLIGLLLAGVVTLAFKAWHPDRQLSRRGLDPRRWVNFVVYLFGPFAAWLAKANIDVAIRVITGKIRPGIVKVSPGLKSDLARTVLANSITLTPGTLTVDIDDAGGYYIHWLYVEDEDPSEEQLYGSFAKWARRLAE